MRESGSLATVDYENTNAVTISRGENNVVSIHIQVLPLSRSGRRQLVKLGLYALAALFGLHGSVLMRGPAFDNRMLEAELEAGAPFLLLAMAIWLLAECVGETSRFIAWWRGLDRLRQQKWLLRILPTVVGIAGFVLLLTAMRSPIETSIPQAEEAAERLALAAVLLALIEALFIYLRRSKRKAAKGESAVKSVEALPAEGAPSLPARVAPQITLHFARSRLLVSVCAALASGYLWVHTADNNFPPPLIALWLLSAVLWALALAPPGWRFLAWLRDTLLRDRTIPWRKYWWAYIAFAAVLILGFSFRFTELDQAPPELLNDPYITLVDAYDFVTGAEQPVYFTYNNGRPVLTLYLAAAAATLPGQEFSYYALKLSTVLASLASLPIMFWLGYEFLGGGGRKKAIAAGLLLAGFVAASYWETVISRDGATASLTGIAGALVVVLLIRAIRHNRRWDFILTGLALGFSLYTYHQARIFPFAVMAAVLTALVIKRMTTRERAAFVLNSVVCAAVAFMVFLPMFRFMIDWPESFWQRSGQLTRIYASGVGPELSQTQLHAHALLKSAWEHLMMFHWHGDTDFHFNLPGNPALNVVTGALLALSLPALGFRLLRSRDPVRWALPFVLAMMCIPAVIVLDPSAHTPGHPRMIGAAPLIYLLAALPLVVFGAQLLKVMPRPLALALSALIFSAAILVSNHLNTSLYFDQLYPNQVLRTRETADAGKILRGFFESGGAVGNSFIVQGDLAEPRFIAADAGVLYYDNVIWDAYDIPYDLRRAWEAEEHRLDPARDLLFLFSPNRVDALSELQYLFPDGYPSELPSTRPNVFFGIYRVPALGEARLNEFLDRH